MTAVLTRVRNDLRRQPAVAGWGMAFAVTWVAVGILTVQVPLVARIIMGLAVLGSYFIIALNARPLALTLVVIWLTFLGFIRRILIPFVGFPEFDPLLLLGPACAVILWLTAERRRAPRTAIHTLVVIFLWMTVAQILNPYADNLAAGPISALFWVGPLLWFFVGRTLSEEFVVRILRLVTILVIPVAFHGLYQTFVGLLPFELTWVGVSQFGPAIFLENFRIRPFSTLTSPQEYGAFLAFALVVLWAHIITTPEHRTRRLGFFLIGLVALFMQGTRSIFFFFGLAIVVMSVVRARAPGARLVMSSMVAVVLLLFGMWAARPGQEALTTVGPQATTAEAVINHQIQGFTHPQQSTLPIHLEMIAHGFQTAWENPLGVGIAGTSIVVQKLDEEGSTTENDVAQVFLALGIPGGLLFIVLMLAIFRESARRARRLDMLPLAILGMLIAMTTGWYAGQMYLVSSLVWILFGFLSRPVLLERTGEGRGDLAGESGWHGGSAGAPCEEGAGRG